jgi:hypothetical protein
MVGEISLQSPEKIKQQAGKTAEKLKQPVSQA